MRVIIAGSRHLTISDDDLTKAMELGGFTPTEIVSGTARGIDRCGEEWAKARGIKLRLFPAHWNEEGKVAGFLRNKRMAQYANALVAVWDGKSRGTKHMIETMERANKPVQVWIIPVHPTPQPR